MLVTQHGAGYNGFSWDLMGFHGSRRISAVFNGEIVGLFFSCSQALSLWISL
jgi:hypothetical protein